MSRDALIRYRADRLLRRDFSGLRPRVIAVVRSHLRSHGVELDRQDLDACYALAWQGLYSRTLAGEQIDDVAAWLVLVTYRRALDELRALSRQSRISRALAERALPRGSGLPTESDFAAELDNRVRFRHALEALNASFSPREREAASLCYLQGLSRLEAARRMRLSDRRMSRLMDGSSHRAGVAAKVNALLDTIGASRWCEQQGSLMRAYAFGILHPEGERHALARAHLRQCPACRAFVLSLRGLATVLPPLPLPLTGSAGARRATPERVRPSSRLARVLAPHGVRAPLAKLALIFAAALSVGGGMVVLARGASHPAPRARSVPRSRLAMLQPHQPSHRPRQPTRHHGAHRRAGRHAAHHRRAQAVLSRSFSQAPSAAPAAATSSFSQPASEAPAPSEEFGPERASSRRG